MAQADDMKIVWNENLILSNVWVYLEMDELKNPFFEYVNVYEY